MLAPARPSPTRAGVSSRRRFSERDDGAGAFVSSLLGRDRRLAQPDRIVRCVLLTARSLAREYDQVVRNHCPTDQALELAMPPSSPPTLPASLLVVAEHADFRENIAQHDQTAPDIGPALHLGADRHFQPIGVGVFALVLIARKEFLRLVGGFHAFAPRTDDLLIRQTEIDIGVAAVIVMDQTAFALEAI